MSVLSVFDFVLLKRSKTTVGSSQYYIYGESCLSARQTYQYRTATKASESPYLTLLDRTGMMAFEEQPRREMIARHKEDMIRQIASSSENTAQVLTAMNPPHT